MTSLFGLLADLGPWNWFFAGLLLIALETVVPGVHFLWFGVSALAVGTLTLLLAPTTAALGLSWQLVLFALISVATVFWVRNYARAKLADSDAPLLNERGAQYQGRIVVVAEAISGGRGKVRVGDTLWPAEGADAAAGTHVRITGASGPVLRVEPA